MSEVIQYDSSAHVVGGVNIAETVISDKRLVYNESYTVAGERLEAPTIYACYDLTVIGDIEAEEIEIHGDLRVTGSIKTRRLYCQAELLCTGNIDADSITAEEIIAGSIACKTLTCPGNIIVRTTIDIGESLAADMSVITGEGIIGTGVFSARNGIAVDYFSFDGEVNGRVLELDSDKFFGNPKERPGKINRELKRIESRHIDEKELLQVLKQISSSDINMLSDWHLLAERLVQYACLDKIANLRDYLYIIMAKKILPFSVTGYKTVEHVFSKLLPEAEANLTSMEYHATDISEVAYSLKIVGFCESELGLDSDEFYDRILQSIGIKYNTAKDYLG